MQTTDFTRRSCAALALFLLATLLSPFGCSSGDGQNVSTGSPGPANDEPLVVVNAKKLGAIVLDADETGGTMTYTLSNDGNNDFAIVSSDGEIGILVHPPPIDGVQLDAISQDISSPRPRNESMKRPFQPSQPVVALIGSNFWGNSESERPPDDNGTKVEVLALCESFSRTQIELAEVPAPYAFVNYDYHVSTHEITNTQYAQFLQAVARIDDPHRLFRTTMQYMVHGGIMRRRTRSGTYCYKPKRFMEDKPVNYVTWINAARFVNWLENGKPEGLQDETTTENGTYDLTSGPSDYLNAQRHPNATWALPTMQEWMKAAYHDPNRSSFWDFATQSDVWPASSTATDTGVMNQPGHNVVNYERESNWNGTTGGNDCTIGSADNTSYYGVADLNGNVAEWTEFLNCLAGPCGREIRGGAFNTVSIPDDPNPNLPPDAQWINMLTVSYAPIYGQGGERFRQAFVGFRVVKLD